MLTCLRTRPPAAHLRVGFQGEAAAVRYLRSAGYAVIARNIRIHRDEIDILAFDPSDHVLAFVEVKSRSKAGGAYDPGLNLTVSKKRAMRRAARAWVAAHSYDDGWRIDAIFVEAGRVTGHLRQIDA